MTKKTEQSDLRLTENEIRSVIRGEVKRHLNERSSAGLELTMVVGDAILDGVREVVVSAARNPEIRKSVSMMESSNPRAVAEKVVTKLLSEDTDFRSDLVSLVAAIVKRASSK